MLTTFGSAPLGVVSSGLVYPGGTPGVYALVTPAIVLNAATAIRITEPSP